MPLTRRYILPLILCCLALPIRAQQPAEEDEANIRFAQEIHAQLDKMNTELHQIAEEETRQGQITPSGIRSAYFIRNMNSKVQSTDRRLKAFNVRWEAFNAANQAFISDHEDLMDKMTAMQLRLQAANDTLAMQQQRCAAIKDFVAAEEYILAQDSVYEARYKQAFAMSFVQKLTPQLEKLKATNQAQFEALQEQYDKTKAAYELVPQLQDRADIVNECYYTIKAKSDKIQEMKYMPLLERVKEYLTSLAYVAVILILINMLTAKYKAAKQAKEALEKQAKLIKKENQYPTI